MGDVGSSLLHRPMKQEGGLLRSSTAHADVHPLTLSMLYQAPPYCIETHSCNLQLSCIFLNFLRGEKSNLMEGDDVDALGLAWLGCSAEGESARAMASKSSSWREEKGWNADPCPFTSCDCCILMSSARYSMMSQSCSASFRDEK